MQTLKRISKAGVLALLLALTLLTTGCSGGLMAFKSSASEPTGSASASASAPASQEPVPQAIIDALTVKTIADAAKCKTGDLGIGHYMVQAVAPVGDSGRKWSDAVSTPFAATEPTPMVSELQTTICQDPLHGSMVAHYFANLTIGNVKIVDLNDWLKPYVGEPDKVINVRAASYIPLLNKQNPTAEDTVAAVKANADWLAMAARLNTLLSKFALVGVQAEQSTWNYHLSGGGLAADTLPSIGLNDKQESLPALQFALTNKGQGCMAKIGFNTGDKRLEGFPCERNTPAVCPPGTDSAGQPVPAEGCIKPTPSTPPAASTPPATPPAETCTENCGGTQVCTSNCGGTPGCIVNCGGTPGCVSNCLEQKNIAQAPEQQGNVPQQQYPNQLQATPDQMQPAQPANPAPAYTPPPQNTQTQAPQIDSQTPTSPQPTVAPSTQPPSNGNIAPAPSSGTSCNPDFQSCP